ncbi:MAG: hypothetical protein A2365_00395 [Candidatus Nealsonbacteria bacterium RIFOXYB1_FULL_40_15]|uniref:HTH HARE-type domain-containing protein n=2 Tax=Candidatus Nealsoniibacteriota TaxID=1817911 RepID=A0A1G2ESA8_9BACT|nr:MAG: hypothetical protein A2365_00395 [Candidatus Nealsonbacteria bacterium RIFOXYB1_FULL_40_15]OGZ28422.1 MAG: hypothetical protein A2427_00740 [Candidatus Nealsonbacteria bacterium RIFOXYC1_FULL_40_7]OGZ29010.1 MAG: hypothetical protein A2562_00825 [Candidatus Nealsonbacteria bacterium RIFOXYD1_FULL_39_11]
MEKINYQKICSELIKGLSERTANVIERRFGLKAGEKETLEAIGQTYGITRERVRQIENEGFSHIIPKLENYIEAFEFFKETISSFGGFKREDLLLNALGGEKYQNHAFFLLAVKGDLKRFQEDESFYSLWTQDEDIILKAKKIVDSAVKILEKEANPISLEDLYELSEKEDREVFNSSIEISKKIQQSPDGLYGLKNWVEINPKGIKDKAYLVLKKKEKPMHFTEVAGEIGKLPFTKNKKVHTATVHNELIKDARFVLVGRGLYALAEWGYEPGVVKEVIMKILKDAKNPLTKEEIAEKVLAQRFVKENTIALNLQDKSFFVKDEEGRYNVREA